MKPQGASCFDCETPGQVTSFQNLEKEEINDGSPPPPQHVGSFAMAVVMPSNAVIQLLINNNHPMGFQVKDDDTKFLTCATLGDIVEMYKNILKKPFTSPINKERYRIPINLGDEMPIYSL